MLNITSHEAAERAINYIIECAKNCDYILTNGKSNNEILMQIAEIIHIESSRDQGSYNLRYGITYEVFKKWTESLPKAINCDYHIKNTAVVVLCNILDATPEEMQEMQENPAYTEEYAIRLITYLLYNVLEKYLYNIRYIK